MPKVLQLNATANWGSTGRIAEGIGLAAMSRGWTSYIAYGRYMNPSKSQLIGVGSKFDVYSHYAKNRFLDGEGLGSRKATKNLIKQIDIISPDIIHLHNIHDHWLNYPLLFEYLAKTDVPIVWTFHDCWAFTGGCAYFQNPLCKKWQSKCDKCPLKNRKIDKSKRNFGSKKEFFGKCLSRLHIVSVSKWLDDLVAKSFLSEANHSYIYNGIDITVFKPINNNLLNEEYKLGNKKILVGVATAWSERKGLSSFIKLRDYLPEDYVIVLIGVNNEIIRSLPKGILGIPKTQNIDELVRWYSRAEAVLTFSDAETFGMTIAEGMSCGTPSIGYNCTALKELIFEPYGLPANFGDFDQIISYILSFDKTKEISNQCRLRAEREFNSAVQFNKYIDLYDNLISRD